MSKKTSKMTEPAKHRRTNATADHPEKSGSPAPAKRVLSLENDCHPSANHTRHNLDRLAGSLRGRGVAVLSLQLAFALWLVAAKMTLEGSIQDMFNHLRETHPHLPKQRSLDGWCEGLLAALAARRLMSVADRKPGGRQPKPDDVEELYHITDQQLDQIAEEFGSMSALRRELIPRIEPLRKDPSAASHDGGLLPLVAKLIERLRGLKSPSGVLRPVLGELSKQVNAVLAAPDR